jgi:catechol 2,3-dioxygenase-like lactoylglutathione lyase family enzyme
MTNNLETLLTAYERGACSRRHFIATISALVSASTIGCADRQTAAVGTFVPRGINHVTLKVKDLKKSLEFYQRLFKFPRVEEGDQSYFLGMGSTFLSLDAVGHESIIDHFCIGIDGYDPQMTKQKLASFSVSATIENGNQLYFRDVDGVKVQLSSADYQG